MRTETIEIGRTYEIRSKILDEDRRINVYLPIGYKDNGDRRYPVAYILDGTVTRLSWASSCMEILDGMGRMPCSVVVGIECTDGFRDYFPQPMDSRPGSGKSAGFLRFLTEEIRPWVIDSFRTCAFDILCGFSNSGMFTVHTALSSPSSFSAYIAGSPSIGWFPELFADLASKALAGGFPQDLRLYMNWASDDLERIVSSAMPDFARTLEENADAFPGWEAEMLSGAGHVPYSTMSRGFRSIFRGWSYSREDLAEGGLKGLLDHFNSLERDYGIPVRVPQGSFMDLGHGLLSGGKNEEALAVFGKYAEDYPESHRAHFFLGICLMSSGDRDGARKSWTRTLELEPGFSPARKRLESMDS
jgi:predicted alpha/beta superfamily hydrolase